MGPGELIKERRLKHGLSQRRLAHRAAPSQSAIARIERGDEDVSWKRLESLLLALGEEPVLASKRVWSRYDAWDMEEERKRPPEQANLAGHVALQLADTFRDLAAEAKASGPQYRIWYQYVMRQKYVHHYRQMLPGLLEHLTFRSENRFQPVIEALARQNGITLGEQAPPPDPTILPPGATPAYEPPDRVPRPPTLPAATSTTTMVVEVHSSVPSDSGPSVGTV